MARLRLAGIGCGGRTRTYMGLAARMPELYALEGAADPVPGRLDLVERDCGFPAGFRRFPSAAELLAEEKFADAVIIGTQDADHAEPCIAAMEKGYDIVLEKPIAATVADIRRVQAAARSLGRRVAVCHVLRYTPFYRKAREIVASGELGEIASIRAVEGVGPWHQAHSYVRGHWAVAARSTPMLVAKCCHDIDIILWLAGDRCTAVSSFGSTRFFRPENAPEGAPERCTDGCSHAPSCAFDAHRYLGDQGQWLGYVFDAAETANREGALRWLASSPWGRCAFRCGNDAVDRQVVALEFERGATAVLTMSAFSSGRDLEVFGTRGVLRGGDSMKSTAGCDMVVQAHGGGARRINLEVPGGGYSGHAGGDAGFVAALHHEMRCASPAEMTSSLEASIESHLVGFAAEAARLSRSVQRPEP